MRVHEEDNFRENQGSQDILVCSRRITNPNTAAYQALQHTSSSIAAGGTRMTAAEMHNMQLRASGRHHLVGLERSSQAHMSSGERHRTAA